MKHSGFFWDVGTERRQEFLNQKGKNCKNLIFDLQVAAFITSYGNYDGKYFKNET